jgi:hypothetical protein
MKRWGTGILSVFVLLFAVFLLYWSDNYILFNLAYVFVCFYLISRAVFSAATVNDKLIYISAYGCMLVLQLVYNTLLAFDHPVSDPVFRHYKLLGIFFLLVPFAAERLFFYRQNDKFFIPTLDEWSVISYTQLMHNKDLIVQGISKINRAGQSLSTENLTEIINDLPRHSSFRYISNGSLTDAYFQEAYASLDDEYVYLVITDSGSAASGLISLFTNKQYNHVSLSFDRDLHTIISYNGGEKISPPGLNPEMIENLQKNENSSVMVYKLKAATEQKKAMIDKVREINAEGSAYNLLGLVFKYSHKPNIMFCSQFVYQILAYANLIYFKKKPTQAGPLILWNWIITESWISPMKSLSAKPKRAENLRIHRKEYEQLHPPSSLLLISPPLNQWRAYFL